MNHKEHELNDKCPRGRLKYRLKQQVRKYATQNEGRVWGEIKEEEFKKDRDI
jgi:hypothetical protein